MLRDCKVASLRKSHQKGFKGFSLMLDGKMSFRVVMCQVLFLVVVVLLLGSCVSWGAAASVSYDNRAIVVNGQRRILISGSIHYPRSTPEVYFFLKMYFMIKALFPFFQHL